MEAAESQWHSSIHQQISSAEKVNFSIITQSHINGKTEQIQTVALIAMNPSAYSKPTWIFLNSALLYAVERGN